MSQVPNLPTDLPNNCFRLEGWLSVRAALIGNKRDIYRIYLRHGNTEKQYKSIIRKAEENKVQLEFVDKEMLDSYCEGSSHGGAVAFVGPRHPVPIEDLGQGTQASFLVILDGIEDPYNLGQALRSLHASGCHGVIMGPRNWDSATSIIGKASAGAAEFVAIAQTDDLQKAIDLYKERGLTFVCTDLSDRAKPLFKANLRESMVMMIGGERRGIKNSILKQADSIVRIPYGRNFQQSLDSTSAVAVVAFEVLRQRFFK